VTPVIVLIENEREQVHFIISPWRITGYIGLLDRYIGIDVSVKGKRKLKVDQEEKNFHI
jgi:hypothetical protein